jgi:hypothetical protein
MCRSASITQPLIEFEALTSRLMPIWSWLP